MKLKIQYLQEIHLFKGASNSFEELLNFTKQNFKNLPPSFKILYRDCDDDLITISCDEDLKAIGEEAQNVTFKLMIFGKDSDEYQQSEIKKPVE